MGVCLHGLRSDVFQDPETDTIREQGDADGGPMGGVIKVPSFLCSYRCDLYRAYTHDPCLGHCRKWAVKRDSRISSIKSTAGLSPHHQMLSRYFRDVFHIDDGWCFTVSANTEARETH